MARICNPNCLLLNALIVYANGSHLHAPECAPLLDFCCEVIFPIPIHTVSVESTFSLVTSRTHKHFAIATTHSRLQILDVTSNASKVEIEQLSQKDYADAAKVRKQHARLETQSAPEGSLAFVRKFQMNPTVTLFDATEKKEQDEKDEAKKKRKKEKAAKKTMTDTKKTKMKSDTASEKIERKTGKRKARADKDQKEDNNNKDSKDDDDDDYKAAKQQKSNEGEAVKKRRTTRSRDSDAEGFVECFFAPACKVQCRSMKELSRHLETAHQNEMMDDESDEMM